jgi:hypothetical protein
MRRQGDRNQPPETIYACRDQKKPVAHGGHVRGNKISLHLQQKRTGEHAPAIKADGRTTHEIKIVGGRGYWRVGTGGALVESGGNTWFFLTADYAFGYALEKDTSDIVTSKGGKVLGSVRVPLKSSDFSSFLLQAQNSKAKIIGLANAGLDTTNSISRRRSLASSNVARSSRAS